jgi:putative endonuclease
VSTDTSAFGAHGEAVASAALARRGYRIVERNYRSRWGELDVVAYDGDTLVFVEVKARRGAQFGDPAFAVDRRKQRRLVRLAQQYLSRRRLGEPLCRLTSSWWTSGRRAATGGCHHERVRRLVRRVGERWSVRVDRRGRDTGR